MSPRPDGWSRMEPRGRMVEPWGSIFVVERDAASLPERRPMATDMRAMRLARLARFEGASPSQPCCATAAPRRPDRRTAPASPGRVKSSPCDYFYMLVSQAAPEPLHIACARAAVALPAPGPAAEPPVETAAADAAARASVAVPPPQSGGGGHRAQQDAPLSATPDRRLALLARRRRAPGARLALPSEDACPPLSGHGAAKRAR